MSNKRRPTNRRHSSAHARPLPRRRPDPSEFAVAFDVQRTIRDYGFAIIAVGTGKCSVPGCRCQPTDQPWSYTIGRSEMGRAELLTTGVYDERFATKLTNHVAHLVDAHELLEELEPGEAFNLGPLSFRLDPVPIEWLVNDLGRMGQWLNHYTANVGEIGLPELIQIVWSDDRHRFPDDPTCNATVRRYQGLLALDPIGFPAIDFDADLAG
jgi:hypothetical protein